MREHPETPLGLIFGAAFGVGAVIGTAIVLVPMVGWWTGEWVVGKIKKARSA